MSEPVPLSRATLGRLPAGVRAPAYDPAEVRAGIVHLGFGGFHRAHMARYLHDLMTLRSDAREWGVVGIGLLPADVRVRDALEPQDGLYTLVERQDEDEDATIIGSVHSVVFVGDGSREALERIDDPAVRIVSLTVTEYGYCLDAAKALDRNHPAIVHDLAYPEAPRSAVGIVVEALRRRMAAGGDPFTALSCDNIQHNGAVLRRAVLGLAGWRDPALAAWIAERGGFPNTMVDRITPVTTPQDVDDVAARFGVADRWPVVCERFRQWVVEDAFVAGRPALEVVGVQFTADVAPFEAMKLRLLNASHLAVAGLARLLGCVHIDEAMRAPGLRDYMRALMDRETGPTLPPVPGVDLDAYKAQLVARFGNTRIKDTVDRVNADAPVTLLLEPLGDRLAAGGSVDLLALALAAWMRRAAGEDEIGEPIRFVHPLAALLRERARAGGADPRPLLTTTEVFGDLGRHERLVEALRLWLTALYGSGVSATLAMARRELDF